MRDDGKCSAEWTEDETFGVTCEKREGVEECEGKRWRSSREETREETGKESTAELVCFGLCRGSPFANPVFCFAMYSALTETRQQRVEQHRKWENVRG